MGCCLRLRLGCLGGKDRRCRFHRGHGVFGSLLEQCTSFHPSYGPVLFTLLVIDTNILQQFTGTNIGTTILLCRILQSWEDILASEGRTVSDRTFWGAVYSMALGVNFGAFSSVLCASLAGLLWHSILVSKGIVIGRMEFFRVNAPIIGVATAVGCAVLIGQVYIIRNEDEYSS